MRLVIVKFPALITITVTLVIAFLLRGSALRCLAKWHWYRECLHYDASPDFVVYDEAADPHSYLVLPRGYSRHYTYSLPPVPVISYCPPCFTAYCKALYPVGFNNGATMFLHDRRSPDGEHALVLVEA